MAALLESLGLDVRIDYQQKRWHCDIRATLLPSLKAWGGAGRTIEEAVNSAIHELLRDVTGNVRIVDKKSLVEWMEAT